MKIWEYLSNKDLYGGGLTDLENQVLRCLGDNDPEVKKKLKHEFEQYLLAEELGEVKHENVTNKKN